MIFCILPRRLMNFVLSSICPMKTIMDMVERRTNIRNGHADRLRKFMPSEKFTHRIRTDKVCLNDGKALTKYNHIGGLRLNRFM